MEMKRKKLVTILTALVVAVSSSIPVFASQNTAENSKIETNISSDYITSVIQSNSDIDPTCPWTENTQVQEVIPTYDLDNNVSGYILNLSTDGNNTGYMVYDISSGEAVLTEFGYENVYTIQGEEVTQKSKLGQSKLIPVGMNEYVLQRDNDLYTIKTNTKITDKKDEIQTALERKETNIAEYVQSEQMASALSTRAQEIYTSVSLPNLWKPGYQPVTMQMYGNKGCAVVFGVNLLKYWSVCRDIPSLYNSYDTGSSGVELQQTYNRLWISMKTDSNGSTGFVDGFNGIPYYCSTYACTAPKGNDYKTGLNWDWYKTQVNNGNFMCVNAKVKNYQNDGRNSNHSFSGVGYQETSTGNFMRVGDQWTTDYSHFFNVSAYSGDIYNIWYYRWK